MSSPNPTTLMADWLSVNLADWLYDRRQQNEGDDLHHFVHRCVLPHISSYGVNSMYEFMKDDYDDDECDISPISSWGDEVSLNPLRQPNPEKEGTNGD
jgi:hypothetical protein